MLDIEIGCTYKWKENDLRYFFKIQLKKANTPEEQLLSSICSRGYNVRVCHIKHKLIISKHMTGSLLQSPNLQYYNVRQVAQLV